MCFTNHFFGPVDVYTYCIRIKELIGYVLFTMKFLFNTRHPRHRLDRYIASTSKPRNVVMVRNRKDLGDRRTPLRNVNRRFDVTMRLYSAISDINLICLVPFSFVLSAVIFITYFTFIIVANGWQQWRGGVRT